MTFDIYALKMTKMIIAGFTDSWLTSLTFSRLIIASPVQNSSEPKTCELYYV